MFRKNLVAVLLLASSALCAQNIWTDPAQLSSHRIQTITTEGCRQEFGKADTCSVAAVHTYDREGRLVKTVSQSDQPGSHFTAYTYNAKGQRTEVYQVYGTDTTVTTNEYGANGLRTKSVTKRNGKITSVTTLTYNGTKLTSFVTKNEKGEISNEVKYTFDQSGNLKSGNWISNSSGQQITTLYNSRKQKVVDTIKTFKGEVVNIHVYTYSNDTLASQVTYGGGRFVSETRYTYDTLLRLVRRENTDSVNPYNTYTIVYHYDPSGNMIEEATTRSNYSSSTYYTYDSEGKLLAERHHTPERVIMTYRYSAKGELLEAVNGDRSKDSVVNTYDSNGLKTRSQVIKGRMVISTDYTYDNNGHLVNEKRYNGIRPDSLTLYWEMEYRNDGEGKPLQAIHKNYLLRNALDGKAGAVPPSEFTMTYTYDDRDSLLSIIGVAGKAEHVGEQSTRYTYGKNGKAQQVANYYPGTDRVKSRTVYEYDDSARVQSAKYYFGADTTASFTVQYHYDAGNRVSHTLRYNSWGELVEHHVYVYDENGLLIKIVDGGRGATYRKYRYETY